MSRWNGVTVTLPDGEALRCGRRRPSASPTCRSVLGERGGPAAAGACSGATGTPSGTTTEPTRAQGCPGGDRLGESPPPGVLGYLDDRPVGWCAIAPRAEYPRMQSSPTFGPVDDTRVVGGVVPVHPPHGAPARGRRGARRCRRGDGQGIRRAGRRRHPRRPGAASAVRPTSTRARRRCSSPSGSPRSPAASPNARSSGWRPR